MLKTRLSRILELLRTSGNEAKKDDNVMLAEFHVEACLLELDFGQEDIDKIFKNRKENAA